MENMINLSHKSADCKIALWGGNLISYRPKNQEHDIFWLGDFNKFDNVHAIRGGIPVCWPRFAEEALNNHLPRHGFARLSEWKMQNITVDEDCLEAKLCLIPDKKFEMDVAVNLAIKITDKLEYRLETVNNGSEIFKFSEALHAYFNVSSLENVEIKGLTNHNYKNSLNGKTDILRTNLKINSVFDAIFKDHTQNIEIIDTGFKRIISIEKSGSNTTVVWNPAQDLAEMSVGQYKKFVCVEPSNVGDFAVCLQPHEKHVISMTVRAEKLK